MSSCCVVFITCATPAEAHKIAHQLVEKQLAACVNILDGVQSVYRWKGSVESAKEHMLVVKSRQALVAQIKGVVNDLHSYDCPEVIAVPINDGSDSYLDWIEKNTSGL